MKARLTQDNTAFKYKKEPLKKGDIIEVEPNMKIEKTTGCDIGKEPMHLQRFKVIGESYWLSSEDLNFDV